MVRLSVAHVLRRSLTGHAAVLSRSAARLTRITVLVILTACAAKAASAQASAALPADVLSRIDSAVQAEMTKEKIPGVAVGIVRHGTVALAKGYGLANVELAAPAGPETMFQSGSLGKQFTAAALMLQVEDVHRHTGSWQGFKTALSRYLGSDLTIIALANLGEAHPSVIVQQLAGIIEPHLQQPESAPISDADSAVTTRVRTLLDAAARGALAPKDFVDPPTGFFPEGAKEYRSLLGKLGSPTRVDLLQRRKLGDDQVYRYRARYGDRAMQVELALAPGGKVAGFDVSPE
jgi:hypothetical protein